MRSKADRIGTLVKAGVQQENPSRVPVGSGINDADNGPNEVNYLGCGLGGLAIALSDFYRCSTTRFVNTHRAPPVDRQATQRCPTRAAGAAGAFLQEPS